MISIAPNNGQKIDVLLELVTKAVLIAILFLEVEVGSWHDNSAGGR